MGVKKYAIVDIETTGGLYIRDKIIEIAIIVTDGQQIISEFQSLIYPERSIPYSITRITGIDDSTVQNAPRFFEIARDIIGILEGCIFVAHNVRFDYSFIKEEFASLGYPFNKKNLCTVKLTRSRVPGLRSYGLDNLVRHFGLTMKDRHRAYGDAYATFELFCMLLQDTPDDYHLKQLINLGIDESVLPKGISIEDMHNAPETPGVYYLIDKQGSIVYIGKAKNIKKRLFQHFRQMSKKSLHIHNHVDKLRYTETGDELIALLLELHEIKTLKPELNRALRRTTYPYGLYYRGYAGHDKASFIVSKNSRKNEMNLHLLKLFGSKLSADSFVQSCIDQMNMCKKEFKSSSKIFSCPCENQCQDFFSDRAANHHSFIKGIEAEFEQDFVVLLNGRHREERSFVIVKDRRFTGFGYIGNEETILEADQWLRYLTLQFNYPEADGIIKNHLRKNQVEIIEMKEPDL